VFSTKYRTPFITDKVRNNLHGYIIGTLAGLGSYVNEVYANPDHIHILCRLPRTITIAKMISITKTSSAKWLKKEGIKNFKWQGGYAVFSVSESIVEIIERYIVNQPEHHKNAVYKDELRRYFKRYKVDYDEKYVWD